MKGFRVRAPRKVLTPAEKAIASERRKLRAAKSAALFLGTLRVRNLPLPIAEAEFALELGREWRFDYVFREQWLAVEQEGLSGRHQFTAGFIEDMKKYRTAALLGWSVARFTVREMESGAAAEWIADFIRRRGKR